MNTEVFFTSLTLEKMWRRYGDMQCICYLISQARPSTPPTPELDTFKQYNVLVDFQQSIHTINICFRRDRPTSDFNVSVSVGPNNLFDHDSRSRLGGASFQGQRGEEPSCVHVRLWGSGDSNVL